MRWILDYKHIYYYYIQYIHLMVVYFYKRFTFTIPCFQYLFMKISMKTLPSSVTSLLIHSVPIMTQQEVVKLVPMMITLLLTTPILVK